MKSRLTLGNEKYIIPHFYSETIKLLQALLSLLLVLLPLSAGVAIAQESTEAQTFAFKDWQWFYGETFQTATFYSVNGQLTKRNPASVDSTIDLSREFVIPEIASPASSPAYEVDARPDTTVWLLRPSFKYDALAFLGVLTGDPFYVDFYPDAYVRFEPLLTPEARAALAELKRKVKDEGGSIISANLTLVFSASDAETLPEMQAALNDAGPMKEAFAQTSYADSWLLFESVIQELQVLLEWYEDVEFHVYWENEVRPLAEARINELSPKLFGYDVLGETARFTGRQAPLDTLTVYILRFVKPHGIKITGSRFLTAISWPFSVVLPDAVHEMLHPPYDLDGDAELRAALNRLRAAPFLMERIEHHDPDLGYNTFEGFVEEDVVQALEQVVLERLGVNREPQAHWCRQDGGMHVLAMALYSVMKQKQFIESGQTVRDFLIQEITQGALQPGSLRAHYEAFYAGAPCEEVL